MSEYQVKGLPPTEGKGPTQISHASGPGPQPTRGPPSRMGPPFVGPIPSKVAGPGPFSGPGSVPAPAPGGLFRHFASPLAPLRCAGPLRAGPAASGPGRRPQRAPPRPVCAALRLRGLGSGRSPLAQPPLCCGLPPLRSGRPCSALAGPGSLLHFARFPRRPPAGGRLASVPSAFRPPPGRGRFAPSPGATAASPPFFWPRPPALLRGVCSWLCTQPLRLCPGSFSPAPFPSPPPPLGAPGRRQAVPAGCGPPLLRCSSGPPRGSVSRRAPSHCSRIVKAKPYGCCAALTKRLLFLCRSALTSVAGCAIMFRPGWFPGVMRSALRGVHGPDEEADP